MYKCSNDWKFNDTDLGQTPVTYNYTNFLLRLKQNYKG